MDKRCETEQARQKKNNKNNSSNKTMYTNCILLTCMTKELYT